LFEDADDLAERAVQLGGTAFGTARSTAKTSRLSEYPLDIGSGREQSSRFRARSRSSPGRRGPGSMRQPRWANADTADLFTEISRGIDKLLWKVEAHA